MNADEATGGQRTVLIVSPHFPPSTLAGVHRARHLAKYLPAHGWRPIIIRADEAHYTEKGDAGLARLVPASVEQVRTSALSARFARRFGVGDIGLRAYHAIGRAVAEAAARRRPAAVLITGSPYYPMLLTGRIQKNFNIPVVLDFQDPWVSADGARAARLSKAHAAHSLALFLEPRALAHAAWITSVSETQNREMAARYPWLDASRMSAIPIGGDPDDFAALRTMSPPAQPAGLERGFINICYVGTFLPRAAPVVRTFFEAVARVRRQQPKLAERLRFVFVGTSNQPSGPASQVRSVLPIAMEAGVDDLVREHPARVPFLDALNLLANANGLLLLGSDEPHYTASKIYPALMAHTPYLSIFHAASSSHQILSAAGGGSTFAFSNSGDLERLAPALAAGIVNLAERPDMLGRPDPASYERYTANSVAAQFADVFNRIAI